MLSSSLVQRLGYAGLIPFLITALWAWFDPSHQPWANQLFVYYSAIILSFMAGTLWGRTLHTDIASHPQAVFITTNIVAVTAWLVLALGFLTIATGVLLLGFVAILWTELRYLRSTPASYPNYATMRFVLTTIVVACHLLMLFSGE